MSVKVIKRPSGAKRSRKVVVRYVLRKVSTAAGVRLIKRGQSVGGWVWCCQTSWSWPDRKRPNFEVEHQEWRLVKALDFSDTSCEALARNYKRSLRYVGDMADAIHFCAADLLADAVLKKPLNVERLTQLAVLVDRAKGEVVFTAEDLSEVVS